MSRDKLKFDGALPHETNDQSYYRGMISLYGYMMTIGYNFKKDDAVREKMRYALEQFNELEKERVKKL